MERRGDWQLWAENLTDATDELHLDAGKSYMVRVRAKNANGSKPVADLRTRWIQPHPGHRRHLRERCRPQHLQLLRQLVL